MVLKIRNMGNYFSDNKPNIRFGFDEYHDDGFNAFNYEKKEKFDLGDMEEKIENLKLCSMENKTKIKSIIASLPDNESYWLIQTVDYLFFNSGGYPILRISFGENKGSVAFCVVEF